MTTKRDRVAELAMRRAKVREMGGTEKVAKQHDRGKLTARERLVLLFDGGDFVEVGIHGTEMGPGAHTVPADAVVCGGCRDGTDRIARASSIVATARPSVLTRSAASATSSALDAASRPRRR